MRRENSYVDNYEVCKVGDVWEAIGPFPSGMREHPLTASPLHAFATGGRDPDLDFAFRWDEEKDSWPSELSDGGRVGWTKFHTGEDGWTEVAYPDIRWQQLRADRGWASLQYQVILRTSFRVPWTFPRTTTCIRVDVKQLTEYAIVQEKDTGPLTWYQGDMYDFAGTRVGRTERSTSNFARSMSLKPGEYTLIARAVYEIRLFGDPGDKPPTIRFRVDAEEDVERGLRVLGGLDIVPDIVDGWIMGGYMAIAIHNPPNPPLLTVRQASVDHDSVSVELVEATRIMPGQTRMVVLAIRQSAPLRLQEKLSLKLTFEAKKLGEVFELQHTISFRHHAKATAPFRITFPSPIKATTGLPAQVGYAMVLPPKQPSWSKELKSPNGAHVPVVLALHGAGVDVEWETWLGAIPATGGWAVLPTGKNEWGEDWHGASMADAWAARDAVHGVLKKLGRGASDKTLLMGHSNGGQGAWHLAARYPDRIVGVIAAAGYLKIQDYVPYTELTGHHHADPALMGILLSSLSPYNNDLHLSNLVGIPCLALHGGADSNVPPRHSRAYASIIDSWQHDSSSVEVVEVPGEDHWWEGMMGNPRVQAFIERVLSRDKPDWDAERKMGFTLSAAVPEENGGRAGIRIVEVDTPGRIARLDVNAPHWRDGSEQPGLDLRGMNVKRIEMVSQAGMQTFSKQKGTNKMVDETDDTVEPYHARAYGPMIRILASSGPLHIVIGNEGNGDVAIRLAHDVFVHHRLDSAILLGQEALELVAQEKIAGNIVTIGRPEDNAFTDWLVKQKRIPVTFPTKGILQVSDKLVYDKGSGIISLHPHPTNPKGLAMIIAGNDDAGLETAARLFPLRTGVPVPDWVVVGSRMSWQAAGGMLGAGFWDGQWGWNESMSWFDR